MSYGVPFPGGGHPAYVNPNAGYAPPPGGGFQMGMMPQGMPQGMPNTAPAADPYANAQPGTIAYAKSEGPDGIATYTPVIAQGRCSTVACDRYDRLTVCLRNILPDTRRPYSRNQMGHGDIEPSIGRWNPVGCYHDQQRSPATPAGWYDDAPDVCTTRIDCRWISTRIAR
jgi:hypothetical protein